MRSLHLSWSRSLIPSFVVASLCACSTAEGTDRTADAAVVAAPVAPVKVGVGALETLRAFPTFASVARGGILTRDARGFSLGRAPQFDIASGLRAIAPTVATAPVHIESAADADAWVDVAPLDVAPSEATSVDRAVVYRDVAPDLDVVQVLGAESVEELRLLRGPGAKSVARYRVRLGPTLTELRAREGHVEAVAANGYVHLATEPMFAVDARGVRREVAVRVDRDGDAWTVEASFDASGLAYPIAVDPVWSTVASMATPRTQHAAVKLKTGQVLVVGGIDASGTTLNTAEKYDPATNKWSSAGSFTDRRADPTATLLDSSGNVLVVGGSDSGSYRTTAQRYNAAKNFWSSAGTLGNGMFHHTATYIPTAGKVLVVGGYGNSTNAYLYTVSTNTWTATNAVPDAPNAHTRAAAVLVGHGVLVAGGQTGTGVTGASDMFVPNATTGTWITKGALATPRMNHALVALSGTAALAVGGTASGTAVAAAERYVSTLNGWGAAGTMSTGRDHARAVLVGTRVLVAGGGPSLASADLFDTATLTWAPVTAMPEPRVMHELVALNTTQVLVIGGTSGSTKLSSVLRYTTPTIGMACTSATDCPFLGGCVDGFCCNTACTEKCYACSAAKKGSGSNGTCGPIANGADPDSECPAKFCTVGTASETNKQVCNGSGACRTNGTTACAAGYLCNAAGTACGTSCTSDASCVPSYHCASGACKADGANGAKCTSNSQCTSGFCVDGVCCNTDCVGPCRACTAAKKGSGTNGTCEFVAADTDPDDECPIDGGYPASCGRDGMCDGLGACRLFAKPSVACGATTCSSSPTPRVAGKVCNGLGVCADSTGVDCAPYGCSSDGTKCATSCAADGDCASTAFCTTAKTCETKRANGASCTEARECSSGSCVDGVCCATDCTSQCAACDVPGKEGTCVAVTGKPHGDRAPCAGEGTACGGTCDGVTVVTCYYPLSTTSCGGACTDGKETKEACDGKGACVEVSSTSCGAYGCGADECLDTCTSDADCATGYRCSEGACIPAAGNTCVDELTAKSGDTVTPCSPFKCENGSCGKICQTSDNCAPGFVCNTTTKVCEPPVAAEAGDEGGGCSVATVGAGGGELSALGLLGLAAALRRRRARSRA